MVNYSGSSLINPLAVQPYRIPHVSLPELGMLVRPLWGFVFKENLEEKWKNLL